MRAPRWRLAGSVCASTPNANLDAVRSLTKRHHHARLLRERSDLRDDGVEVHLPGVDLCVALRVRFATRFQQRPQPLTASVGREPRQERPALPSANALKQLIEGRPQRDHHACLEQLVTECVLRQRAATQGNDAPLCGSLARRLCLERPKRRLALLCEDALDAHPRVLRDALVEVDDGPPEVASERHGHGALARTHRS